MPSHKIHMYIAKKVNEKLKLDLDSIMLGSVLPDLTINKNHAKSHYQYEGTYESELANPDKFIYEYKSKLNEVKIKNMLQEKYEIAVNKIEKIEKSDIPSNLINME